MKRHLIAVAVGPVQEFIASARKLRDLWYGSYLLSERSKAVARALADQGCELIFPAVADEAELAADSRLNVANKILARTPAGADPQELVAAARREFDTHWRELCGRARRQAQRQVKIDGPLFDLQVADFGEFFAVWRPCDDEDYAAARRDLEAQLAGRKNLRTFAAPAWKGAGKPKSSLDGVRETVLIPESESEPGNRRRCFMLKEGEELDALGVVKRFGPWNVKERPFFDNLAQVAVLPYLEGLARAVTGGDNEIIGIIDALPRNRELFPAADDIPRTDVQTPEIWPADLLPELLLPAVCEQEKKAALAPGDTGGERQATWKKLEKGLRRLWQKTREPAPYTALLCGDGDRMGEALDSLRQAEAHRRFSQELDRFAREVDEVVTAHGGKVIYSGGDDLLAYAPLSRALACAREVEQLFSSCMEQAVREGAEITPPTFSLGLAIVHYRSPLFESLARVREAEKCAKQQGGRDALALLQDKRGGSPLKIWGQWRATPDPAFPGLPERLQTFITGYASGRLSSRLGYQLKTLEKRFGGRKGSAGRIEIDDRGQPLSALAAEALRLIRHKETAGQMRDEEQRHLVALCTQIEIGRLADELIVARQLYEADRLARGQWQPEKGE
jgi:CRISPR-associated protein Cmr2